MCRLVRHLAGLAALLVLLPRATFAAAAGGADDVGWGNLPVGQLVCAAVAVAIMAALLDLFRASAKHELRAAGRLSDEWHSVSRGEKLAESEWGAANINGLESWSCVQVAVYERGVVVRVHSGIGGGGIWMPIERVIVTPARGAGLRGGAGRRLEDGRHRVVLSAALANAPGLLQAINRAKHAGLGD